jgi:hypothetical protein
MAVTTVPAQLGGSGVLTLVLFAGLLTVAGLVLWGLYALFASVGADGGETDAWARLPEHPRVETTGRYGTDPPEVETTVRERRVVARVETAPGGTDRYAVLQTPTLAVRAGTGFELAGEGGVEFVDRGPETPALPETLWRDIERLPTFGGLTVDDRTGVVEHRFPDPGAVADPELLLAHAETLVGVAEVVEDHAESTRPDGTDATGTGEGSATDREPAVEHSGD